MAKTDFAKKLWQNLNTYARSKSIPLVTLGDSHMLTPSVTGTAPGVTCE